MDILSKNPLGRKEEKGAAKQANEKPYSLKLPQVTELRKMSFAPTGAPKVVLILAIVLLVAMLSVWLAMFLYNQSLDREISEQEGIIKGLEARKNNEMAAKIIGLEKGLEGARNLLENHVFSSQAFRFLEGLTLPKVRWMDFNLDATSFKISLKGLAESYNVLAKQILIFENDARVESVKVSGVALDQQGGVGFSMELILAKNFFKK